MGSTKVTERDIESKLVEVVNSVGGLCLKFIPAYVAGFPDRICLFPGERILFVELKRPGQKPRALQLYWHKKLRKLGFRVEVIDNKVDAIKLALEYGEEE